MQPTNHQPKWNAEDYAKNSSAQMRWAQELISKLLLEGGESVLDVGCGDGKISAQLARATKGRVVGIDQSEEMIRLAVKRYPREKFSNLSFLCMDAKEICISEKFNVAFSNAALHWVKDHCTVLRCIHDCLEPGGKILFQMGGCGNATEVFDAIERVIKETRWRRYYEDFTPPYHFYGPEEYEQWLVKSGFRPVRVALIPKDMQHPGVEGFKGWLRTTWFPYTDCLPDELRDPFLTELAKTYTTEHPMDALGQTHVNMVRLEVEAYAI